MANRSMVLALAGLLAAPAAAQDLVYTPLNPSFGGNPGYSAHLMGTASAQRSATASSSSLGGSGGTGGDGGSAGSSDADLFVRQLQGRLLSALAAQVTEAIFGSNPQESGLVIFGDTTVEFNRSVGAISLVIANALDGTVTEIVVPQLITN